MNIVSVNTLYMDTLKPIIPEIIPCPCCNKQFVSLLKLNAKPYKIRENCRYKNKTQNQKHRDSKKIRLT